MRTPSMVSEVSAIEVASTTLRRPFGAGAMARSCVAGVQRADTAGRSRSRRRAAARQAASGCGGFRRRRAGTPAPSPASARSARGDGVGHLRLDRHAGLAAEIAGLDRERRGLRSRSPARRRAASRRARRRGRRHHQEPQILAQPLLRVARQRQPEIGIERALVKFVEQHRGDAGQFGSSRICRVKMPSVTTSIRVLRDTFEPNRTR